MNLKKPMICLGILAFICIVISAQEKKSHKVELLHSNDQWKEAFRPLSDKAEISRKNSEEKLENIDLKDVTTVEYSRLWLKEESQRMDQIDSTPIQTASQLKKLAMNLSPQEINELKSVTLSRKSLMNEKILSLYLLKLNPMTPIEIYEEIAALPRDNFSNHHSLEINGTLAFRALEEIHIQALSDKSKIKSLEKMMYRAQNLEVKKLAFSMLRATEEGQRIVVGVQ